MATIDTVEVDVTVLVIAVVPDSEDDVVADVVPVVEIEKTDDLDGVEDIESLA